MATFTVEQIAEIERRITFHVGVQSAKFGGFLERGAAQVEEARILLAEHNAELHRSSDRITALVVTSNEKSAELTKLAEDISAFASQQPESKEYGRGRIELRAAQCLRPFESPADPGTTSSLRRPGSRSALLLRRASGSRSRTSTPSPEKFT